MNFVNDEINNNEGCTLLPELLQFETIELFPTYSDIVALNEQIIKLTIDVNTQALRAEIERTKRQKNVSSKK